MPRYDYFCEDNGRTVELVHSMSLKVDTWGDVCRMAGINPGTTAPQARVRKVFKTAPMANTPVGDSDLKGHGWTKLVKRSDGTYENVTRSGTEKRFLNPSDPSSMPHLHKKISD
ncbi:MAG: zinc ribbon domain-containing protein [Proteobacteria bacterium]|jgi:predicted nucleic acid-binding Zn ribbon protein|nr:zinc ribbon domain-containing protein [Pseudomonadota bacterium]MDA1299227.1 zinc ribbon domain-containing protein [Pseudomonadota bacterium]